MKKYILLLLGFIVYTLSFAQEQPKEEFIQSGKIFGHANFRYESNISNNIHSFEFERIRLGYEYKFSKNFTSKLAIEAKQGIEDGKNKYKNLAYVRNAQLKYSFDNYGLSITMGLLSAKLCKVQEKFWSRRYLMKSFVDENKFGATSEFGIVTEYKNNKTFSSDLSIINGNGYKSIKKDSTLKVALGFNLHPIEGLSLRIYGDYNFVTSKRKNEKRESQTLLMFFAGYKIKGFSIAGEYNLQKNYKLKDGQNQSGYSIYGSYSFTKVIELFARYDKLESKDNTNVNGKDGDTYIIGIQFQPIKKVWISPNFKSWNPINKDKRNYVSLNISYKF